MAKTQVSFIGGTPAPAGDFPGEYFVPNYINSWLEFAGQRYQVINNFADRVTTGTETMYTVPQNATLYITSAFVTTVGLTAAQQCSANINIIQPGSADPQFFLAFVYGHADSPSSLTNNFTMPIRVTAGSTIQFTAGISNARVAGAFTGFLVYATA